MATNHITLTDDQQAKLHVIAQQTGKSEDELVHAAVEQLISQFRWDVRRAMLQQARGMWQDRTDLPDFAAIRRAYDQHSTDLISNF